MHRKFNVTDKFKELKMELENLLGKHLRALQSDRGGDYMSIEFDSFLKEHGIMS